MATVRWDGLGSWCEVLTVDDDDLPAAAEIARDEVATLERACSRAAQTSELARLATGRPQQVSRALAGAVAAALRTADFSGGLVAPGDGWQSVRLDAVRGLLTVPDGVELDVCPSARACLADRIADLCADEFGIGCLVNLGGDIAVRGAVPPGGWQVEIDDGPPGPQGRPVIPMAWPGGLASCSSGLGSWRTVTVAARSCERASEASRTAAVLGDSAPRWLTQRELPARLTHAGGVVVQTNGWPLQRWIA
ncbi:MAG TPA: FAD:protein FMN transferase [Propionicimonas sp.]|uniref:FAD:protein FMN transferase n=1 Tax=Propionicimonas sp. TaxID=1955623 RepID=UPI002F42ADE2